ncbi:sodium-dependent transporter [Natranaeroarchaeum sulfidigenes]|uniref:Na+-dependent transporter of the SNF family n=1 Tax=Natranaeroarchaeum sulfidigenes TaxID=2784880 RepID=A0A897MNM3_9EURY|nr:sodium-dependent transporter [Natranaeroarchaeum sulfidigenes]QSG02184.1 Na+-dependent transporter of the SNF family [Natranaeroarchaeum sulfidigenes]
MVESSGSREQWATRLGFILAAVGSAVGLGNIWRFPFQIGQEGGGAFLLIYLLFVVLIGIPVILVEFVIGRRAKQSPVKAFTELGYGSWRYIGGLFVLTGLMIMSFYSVAAGWVLRYTGGSVTGAYFENPEAYFAAVSEGTMTIALHGLFIALTAVIVAAGVKRGIELAVKAMIPALVVVMLVLIGYAATLDGAMAGYSWFLSPDLDVLAENWTTILPAAAGQAFFTLSLGMGVMITYASYIGEDRNLAEDSGWIAGLDTLVAVMAGLIIFPVLFAIGATPGDGGPGELFIGVGGAIAEIPGSHIVGVLFFGVVAIGALSSAISILEVLVSYLIDSYGVERKKATYGMAGLIFLLGVPSAMDLETLDLIDGITGGFMLPLGVFLLVIFVGWVFPHSDDELSKGLKSGAEGRLPQLWLWYVRTVVLFVVAIVLVFYAYNQLVEFGVIA